MDLECNFYTKVTQKEPQNRSVNSIATVPNKEQ